MTRTLHTAGPELVSEMHADGTVRWYRVCRLHQWAYRPVEDPENALPCPVCRCELEEAQGRTRYATLVARLAREGLTSV